MTFRALVSEARSAISAGLTAKGFPQISFDVSEPPRKEFGDLTCNVAFQLSKLLKAPPPKIVLDLVESVRSNLNQSDSLVLSVEAHPAGYLNFRANYQRLAVVTIAKVFEKPQQYGTYDVGKGKTVIIEHTSVNPNKAIHVGHMRNIILGDTLSRVMSASNYQVKVLNYVDDSGLQVADIVIGFKFAGFPLAPQDNQKFDQYCGDSVYVKVNELYNTDRSLVEKRHQVLREIEEGKSELSQFASEVTSRVLKDQLSTCWRLKARYDLLNFESQIVHSNLWSEAFEQLKQKGIARLESEGKNAGAWVIGVKDEEDKVIVRSDGTATYVAKDIPYAAWKLGLVRDPFSYYVYAKQWDGSLLHATSLQPGESLNFTGNVVITVIDSRQGRLQRVISQVLQQMGASNDRYLHLGYEAVTLSAETAKSLGVEIGERQSVQMSGRKGLYVNADYVLDSLHSKAFGEVKTRNPELDDAFTHQIAEEIAISAIRYSLAKQDLDKSITFDIRESLSLEGDTGPYLQYAYARSIRILEKSGIAVENAHYDLLTLSEEALLVKEISKLDMAVEEASKTLSAKSIARYAYSLATAFNLFYEKVPVLREQNASVLHARLALVKAFGITLRNSMNILGISGLQRM